MTKKVTFSADEAFKVSFGEVQIVTDVSSWVEGATIVLTEE